MPSIICARVNRSRTSKANSSFGSVIVETEVPNGLFFVMDSSRLDCEMIQSPGSYGLSIVAGNADRLRVAGVHFNSQGDCQ